MGIPSSPGGGSLSAAPQPGHPTKPGARLPAIAHATPRKLLIGLVLLIILGVATYPTWKPIAKKNKWVVVASNVWLNSLRSLGLRSEQIGQSAVMSFPESRIPADAKRIQDIYRQYLHYAGWSAAGVAGKRVLEIGPGANIGVPLMFAADGANFAAGLDKFVALQEGPYFVSLYSHLREGLSPEKKAAFDQAISLRPKMSLNPRYMSYIDHKELSDSMQQLGPGSFDMIVSNAVMEEIYDLTSEFKAQGQLLRPGGVLVHRIDLGDYGVFSKYGFHPLEFLTVPDWIYQRMVKDSGQPNRRMVDYYRGIGGELGYQTEVHVTQVLGSAGDLGVPVRELRPGVDYSDQQGKLIAEVRPRLLDRYRKLPDADLLAKSIVFVARKPGAGGQPAN